MSRSLTYPFEPRSNAHLAPGQFWAIPLSDGSFACGMVLLGASPFLGPGSRTRFIGGLLDWWGPHPPTAAAIGGAGLVVVSNLHVHEIRTAGGQVLGQRPPPAGGPTDPDAARFLPHRGLTDEAERRWGEAAMEPPYVRRRVRTGRTDEAFEPSPSPLGVLEVQLPLPDIDLALAGDWLGRHPHFAVSFHAVAPTVVDLEFLHMFPRAPRVGIYVRHARDWSGLRHLRSDVDTLRIGGPAGGIDLSALWRFSALRRLGLPTGAADLALLAELGSLEELELGSPARADLAVLTELPRLRSLDLSYGGVRDPAALGALVGLRELRIDRVRALADLLWLARLVGLERLSLCALPKVTSIPNLAPMLSLTRVRVEDLRGVTDLDWIRGQPSLEELSVYGMRQLGLDKFARLADNAALRAVTAVGSISRSRAVRNLLGLPEATPWPPGCRPL